MFEHLPPCPDAATKKDVRAHFVKTEDVRRVAQQHGLGAFEHRLPDHEAVDAMVRRLQQLPDSPVLFYRPATVDQKLCLVLQTRSMRAAMLVHGPYLLACDTTHDTTRYPGTVVLIFLVPCSRYLGLLLGTLMTVGAAGEGQPVLFFLISAESTAELSTVFCVLASRYELAWC